MRGPILQGCEAYKALCAPGSVVEQCLQPGPLPAMVPEEGVDMSEAGANNTTPLWVRPRGQAAERWGLRVGCLSRMGGRGRCGCAFRAALHCGCPRPQPPSSPRSEHPALCPPLTRPSMPP